MGGHFARLEKKKGKVSDCSFASIGALSLLLLGKMLMCFILAYGGYLSIGFIESIFGGGSNIWTIITSAVFLFVIIVVMFKVDWEKVFPLGEKDKTKKS